MSIDFQNAVPAEFMIARPTTTSKAVLNKTLVEIQPNSQTEYAYGGNRVATFDLTSTTGMMNMKESYMKMDICPKLAGGAGIALQLGGVHSLIKRISWRMLSSNTYIHEQDEYHKYYATKSKLLDDPAMIDTIGWTYGDSMSDLVTGQAPIFVNPLPFIASETLLGFVTVGNLLTHSTQVQILAPVGNGLRVGDLLQISIYAADAQHYIGVARVSSVAGAAVFLDLHGSTDNASDVDNAGGVNVFARIYGVARNAAYNDGRSRMLKASNIDEGGGITVSFRLLSPVMEHLWPLFLMKGGIRLTIEFEDPIRALQLQQGFNGAAVTADVSYKIKQPRFMAMMQDPEKEIVDEYRNQFNTDMGLLYSLPGCIVRRSDAAAGNLDHTIYLSPGVRSARRVYTIMQGQSYVEGGDAVTACNDSNADFLRGNIVRYQYRVGTHEFPKRPLDWAILPADRQGYEAYRHAWMVAGMPARNRISVNRWSDTETGIFCGLGVPSAIDSKDFIMAADMSRDNGENASLTGVDLSVAQLQLDVKRSAAFSARHPSGGAVIYQTFIEHDQFLKLSSMDVAVIN